MIRTLTITYDKSNEDTPVLCVAESDIFSMRIIVRKIFTGEKAEQLYNELMGQNVIVKLESENRLEFLRRECFNKPINTEEEEKEDKDVKLN